MRRYRTFLSIMYSGSYIMCRHISIMYRGLCVCVNKEVSGIVSVSSASCVENEISCIIINASCVVCSGRIFIVRIGFVYGTFLACM